MADESDIRSVPTAQDKLSAEFAAVSRFYVAMADNAVQLAKTRKALFDAYRAEGFREAQALELVKGSLLP